MSHDPLLDKIREVRSLLTSFKNALVAQKRFDDRTATTFCIEDREFWTFQAEHDRLKHQGIIGAPRDRLLALLEDKAVQWKRLCQLAEAGESVSADLLALADEDEPAAVPASAEFRERRRSAMAGRRRSDIVRVEKTSN